MEAVIEHLIEPEVAVPAPRRVSLPLRSSLLLGVALLLLGAFVLGSGGTLWEAAKVAWLTSQGQTVSAQIVQIRTEPIPQKGQPPQQTAIRYAGVVSSPQGLRVQTGWVSLPSVPSDPEREVSQRPAETRFRIGQPFALRYAVFVGRVFSQPWEPNPSSRILTLSLTGSMILGVSLLLLRRLLCWRRLRLYLLRQGTATIGTITHTRSEAEDMVRYFLRYGYAADDGKRYEHEEQVGAEQWRLFSVGQPVTVLYDPAQPSRAGLYALIGKP